MNKNTSACSNYDLGRLEELNRQRLRAEKLHDEATTAEAHWKNEAYRRWKEAERLGSEWFALKRELGLLK